MNEAKITPSNIALVSHIKLEFALGFVLELWI